ncbi:MAG: cytochrome c3 family protein [Candidatus Electryonea clarkiae]|nr:cytochrome c3 family protein [Candidatus Electryonea clarkiae]MDP8288842.1 cytochrome c3 family protein [Candidatus Electryonea clarkiae]
MAHEVDGFTPPPWDVKKSVERCGKCHKSQARTYRTGPHGNALFVKGNDSAPGCIGCHTPHPVHRKNSKESPVRATMVSHTCGKCHADKEMMDKFNISSEIVNQYRTSVHGRALLDEHNAEAPSCIGCHGNHGSYNENLVAFEQACARCHSFKAQAFRTSKHQRVWDLTDAPVCITCHGEHDIEKTSLDMVGTKVGTVCNKCHNAGDASDKTRELLKSLEDEYVRGQAILIKAQRAHKNVETELATLEKVRDQLFKARKAIHYFNIDKLKREVDKGLNLSRKISTSIDDLLTESSCITCHSELDEKLGHSFNDDVHSDSEISCHGCHGGNPLLEDGDMAMSRREGFVGVPNRPADVLQFCAKCHSNPDYMQKFIPGIATDQVRQFNMSGHGLALKRNPNDDKVANCVNCHGVHNIRAIDDPLSPVYASNVPETCNECHGDPERMNPYGIITDPYKEYSNSVHGQALLERGDISAPACNDCHGNHGALPPGISSVSHVCGQCHALNENLFKESIHRGIWELRGMQPCGSCHGSHDIHHPTDEMLSAQEGSFCAECHEEGGAPDQIRKMLDSLGIYALEAHDELQRAESYLVDVDKGYFKLDKVHTEMTQMRVLLHRFDLDTMRAEKPLSIGLA